MAARTEILRKALAARANRSLNGRGNVNFEKTGKDEIMTVADYTGNTIIFNLTKRKFMSCSITDSYSSCGYDVLYILKEYGYVPDLRISSWYSRWWKKLHYVVEMKDTYAMFKDKDDCRRADLILPYFEEDMAAWREEVLKQQIKDLINALDTGTYMMAAKRGWKVTVLKPNRPKTYKKRIAAVFDKIQQHIKGITYEWKSDDTFEVIVDGSNIKIYNKPKGKRTNLRQREKTFTLV